MQPTKISSPKVSFGQNVAHYQYALKQLSAEVKAHLFHIKLQSGTNEINTRHFFRLVLTNSSDGSSFTKIII